MSFEFYKKARIMLSLEAALKEMQESSLLTRTNCTKIYDTAFKCFLNSYEDSNNCPLHLVCDGVIKAFRGELSHWLIWVDIIGLKDDSKDSLTAPRHCLLELENVVITKE